MVLYEKLLYFEALAAVRLNHNVAYQFFRNLFKGSGSLENALAAIPKAKNACSALQPVLDQEHSRDFANRLYDRILEQKTLIQKHSHAIEEELRGIRIAQNEDRRADYRLECREALFTSDYSSPIHTIEVPDLTPGTFEWLFADSRFRTWLEEPERPLLWLTADPGCGKSVLAKFLVN